VALARPTPAIVENLVAIVVSRAARPSASGTCVWRATGALR